MDREEFLEIYGEMFECMVTDVLEGLDDEGTCPCCVIREALIDAFNEGMREGSLQVLESFGEVGEIIRQAVCGEE
jgi:hypothetical protein